MKTDFYRTLDRIDNLRISVKLYKTQRNTSFSAVIGGKPGNDVLHDLADGGQGATERVLVAELEVPWQQKMERFGLLLALGNWGSILMGSIII